MIDRRRFVQGAAALSVGPAAGLALAQTWPSRPFRIVVPFAPGGSSDTIARLISKPLTDALRVSVVIENKTGANGVIGAAAVAQSTDQHTVLLTDMSSLAINPLVTKDMPFQPKDVQGVTMLAYSPHLLAVPPSLPVSNLKELVEYSKKQRVNVASAGSGSANHLGVVEIALATGLQWQHVPYKGGAAAMQDTMAGNTQLILNGMLATLPLVQAGKLKAIAVSKRTRVPLLGNVPTIAEQGVPDFESGTYQGVAAPSSLPKTVVARLNTELVRIIREPDMRARLTEAGAEVMTMTPAETNEFLAKEQRRWENTIKRAGKTLEGNV